MKAFSHFTVLPYNPIDRFVLRVCFFDLVWGGLSEERTKWIGPEISSVLSENVAPNQSTLNYNLSSNGSPHTMSVP